MSLISNLIEEIIVTLILTIFALVGNKLRKIYKTQPRSLLPDKWQGRLPMLYELIQAGKLFQEGRKKIVEKEWEKAQSKLYNAIVSLDNCFTITPRFAPEVKHLSLIRSEEYWQELHPKAKGWWKKANQKAQQVCNVNLPFDNEQFMNTLHTILKGIDEERQEQARKAANGKYKHGKAFLTRLPTTFLKYFHIHNWIPIWHNMRHAQAHYVDSPDAAPPDLRHWLRRAQRIVIIWFFLVTVVIAFIMWQMLPQIYVPDSEPLPPLTFEVICVGAPNTKVHVSPEDSIDLKLGTQIQVGTNIAGVPHHELNSFWTAPIYGKIPREFQSLQTTSYTVPEQLIGSEAVDEIFVVVRHKRRPQQWKGKLMVNIHSDAGLCP